MSLERAMYSSNALVCCNKHRKPFISGIVYIIGPGHLTKMAAMAINSKNFKKTSSPEPVDRFPRNLVCSIGDAGPS